MLNQLIYNFDFEKLKDNDDLCSCYRIIHESYTVVDELGVMPFEKYILRTFRHLHRHNKKKKEEKDVPIYESIFTTLRSVYLIARKAVNKAKVKESMISDNLWMALDLILEESRAHCRAKKQVNVEKAM